MHSSKSTTKNAKTVSTSGPSSGCRRWLRNPVRRFAIVFVVALVSLSALSLHPAAQAALDVYLAGIARSSWRLLAWFGIDARLTDTTIWTPQSAVTVARNCAALELMIIFAAGAIAFPSAWWKKFAGMLLCLLLLPAANTLRVASLFLVGRSYAGSMEAIHREVWPVVLMLFTLALWLAWFAWAGRDKAQGAHAG